MAEPAPETAEVAEAVAALVDVVDRLRTDRDEDRALIDELLNELARRGAPKHQAPPVYETWQSWVDNWLATRVSRHPHRYRWCHNYAEHPEIADRLETLWHEWERAWPDVTRRPAWFRDGLDHHLPLILAEDGPLRQCSAAEGVHVQPVALQGDRAAPGGGDA